MLRFARSVAKAASSPTLTIFHNSNSRLSLHLLDRLATHDSRYTLDVRTNKLPSYETYSFIHQECMNVHPQNNRSFEKIFPALLASPSHSFCNVEVKRGAKQKQFVPDLELLPEPQYMDSVALHSSNEVAPFVVDWANKLVAVDDEGLDTIMQNYYSCGMQKSRKVHQGSSSDHVSGPGSGAGSPPPPSAFQSVSFNAAGSNDSTSRYLVHPHMAEFADLY